MRAKNSSMLGPNLDKPIFILGSTECNSCKKGYPCYIPVILAVWLD